MSKLLLKMNSNLGKFPNQKTHESESAGFLVWPFPMAKILYKNIFLIKSYIVTVSNLILSLLVSI